MRRRPRRGRCPLPKNQSVTQSGLVSQSLTPLHGGGGRDLETSHSQNMQKREGKMAPKKLSVPLALTWGTSLKGGGGSGPKVSQSVGFFSRSCYAPYKPICGYSWLFVVQFSGQKRSGLGDLIVPGTSKQLGMQPRCMGIRLYTALACRVSSA